MITKIILLILSFFIIWPPYTSQSDIILILLAILLTSAGYTKKNNSSLFIKHKYYFFIIILICIINFFIPKNEIEEAHSIFVSEKDIDILNDFIPDNVIFDIKNEMNSFDVQRLLNSMHKKYNYDDISTIKVPYAFSSDSIFQNNEFTRLTHKINFKAREDLRIGQLNTYRYNFPFDKEFRRTLPYYVYFQLPNNYKKSKICFKGNFYTIYETKVNSLDGLKSLNFQKNHNKERCIKLIENYEVFHVIGFSIDTINNLEIKLIKSPLLKFFDYTKFILKFLLIILLFKTFTNIKVTHNSFVYLISVISTLILTFIRDPNMIFGLRYLRGGADGIKYNTYAQTIVENLSTGNYFEALRGGTDVFYFMPGLRYVLSIGKFFFGDTNYFYLIICSFIPLLVFVLFKKLFNQKYAYILLISFIFFPIFENMGFGYFNYVWQVVRNHAETLSITLILLGLILLLLIKYDYKNINNINKSILITILSLSFSIAAMCRPNFFLTTSIIIIYLCYLLIRQKNYFNILLTLFFYSTVLLPLIHNYYYGNNFNLFTSASIHFRINLFEFFIGLLELVKFNFTNEYTLHIIDQFSKWNPLYNLHRLLILLIVTFYIITKKNNSFTIILYICALSQHALLIATHPSSRYAYLAWLLTFILIVDLNYKKNLLSNFVLNLRKLIKN